MERHEILEAVRASLYQIDQPRFYETERGFQGALLAHLTQRIPGLVGSEGAIVEQEYQKTLAHHGIRLRPDIIIHRPFHPLHHTSRREGNFAVIALKLKAGPRKAMSDFRDLGRMIGILNYPFGIFINIDHARTHSAQIAGEHRPFVISFATKLVQGDIRVVESRA